MKTKRVSKFLRCLKPNGIVGDNEKCKCKDKNIGDDDDVLGHGDIFLSSHNSFNLGRKPKRYHKKIPHVLKGMVRASSLLNKFGSIKSKVKPNPQTTKNANTAHPNPELQKRNSNDSSSSISTSSSMASSSLASSCSFSYVPSKIRSTPESKKACPYDSKQGTIESPYNINNTFYKQALMDKANGCYFGSNYGICFLILGLLILLTWGKLFAVICTSLCLFFARPRRLKVIYNDSQVYLDDNMLDIVELSDKNIVMEGS